MAQLRDQSYSSMIVKDSLLNIIAVGLQSIAAQLICYPVLAAVFNAEEYGALLTCLGIANAVGISCGAAINNARLLRQNVDTELVAKSSYQTLFLLLAPLCLLSTLSITFIVAGSIMDSALYAAFAFLLMAKGYYSVYYRLVINYRYILCMNCICAVGYLIGSVVVYFAHIWFAPFIMGEVFAMLFICRTSPIVFERPRLAQSNISASRAVFDLLLGALPGNMLTYADRLLIFPILGAASVSIYTVSSIMGKLVGLVTLPISSVLLTHYAKESADIPRNTIVKRFLLAVSASFAGFCAVQVLTGSVLHCLYPTLADQSMDYAAVASLSAIVNVAGSIVSPTFLIVCGTRIQLIIQVAYCLILVVSGVAATTCFGIWGYCLAALACNSIKFLVIGLMPLFYKRA